MEKLSIISLVLMSLLIIGVQCHGTRQGGSGNAQAQSGSAGKSNPSILLRVSPAVLQAMTNDFLNMTRNGQMVWALLVFNPKMFSHTPSSQMGELYRRYRNLTQDSRNVWEQLLLSLGVRPGQIAPQMNTASSSLVPNSRGREDDTGNPARKMQRTQDYAGPRRGTLRIQEPIEPSSDERGKSQREIDLALRMQNQANRGKNKMMPIPSQYKKSAINPVLGRGSGGTSRQPPHPAMPSSYSRSGPGLGLSINEKSDNPRVPQQALRRNNVSADLAPEGFLTLGISENSKYNKK